MGSDRSLAPQQSSFDLASSAAVMRLLVAIRNSDLIASQKNELRDMVFSYRSGNHDPAVAHMLLQQVAAAGIDLEAIAKPPVRERPPLPPTPRHTIGGTRRASHFTPAVVPEVPASKSKKTNEVTEKTPSMPIVASTSADTIAPDEMTSSGIENAPVTPSPTTFIPDTNTNQTPINSSLATSIKSEGIKSDSVIPATPASAATATPETTTTLTPPSETARPAAEVALRRIREIKALVNEKVGNPVNLIDIDNVVGREYMGALLDAMKRLNSGGALGSAMQRLESAYAEVETAIKNHQENSATVKPTTTPSEPTAKIDSNPPTTTAQTPTNLPTATVVSTDQKTTRPVTATTPTKPTPKSIPSTHPSSTPREIVTAPSTPPNHNPISSAAISTTTPTPSRPAPVVNTKSDVAPFKSTNTPVETNEAQTKRTSTKSLAEAAVRLRSPAELPTATSLESASVKGDPLYTKAVDDGLDQLLSDWPLFSKSGFLGTGPKGREHPLFIKIASLQLPLLLAGRFEGATQEIKQSITDYMNGWRYEQGIIYEKNETFEHYLRRVIKHVLDGHKKQKPS